MAAIPLALCPFQGPFLKIDEDGVLVPNAGGKIFSYETDLTTPQELLTNATGTLTPFSNPIVLDDDGWPDPPIIYVLPTGYGLIVTDSEDVQLKTLEFVEDVGATNFATLGNYQSSGTIATSSPYTVAPTDQFVTVAASVATPDPFIVQLQDVTERTTQLVVKNESTTVTVEVTPFGPQEIDSIAAPVILPVSTGVPSPSITVQPQPTAWKVSAQTGF